jgi:hypothetical protein
VIGIVFFFFFEFELLILKNRQKWDGITGTWKIGFRSGSPDGRWDDDLYLTYPGTAGSLKGRTPLPGTSLLGQVAVVRSVNFPYLAITT